MSRFRREVRSAVRPATPADLLALGVGRSTWRGRSWRTTSRGFFVPSDVPLTPAQRILEAVPLVPPLGALTGWASAYVHGVDYLDGLDPDALEPLPVPVCLSSTAGRRDLAGVTYHRDELDSAEITRVLGLPVTTPLRATVDGVSRADNLVEAVVFLDMAGHALELDLAALQAWCVARPGRRGVVQLREALRWCDPRSASPWETRLRMFYRQQAGLPRPETNVPVFDRDGRFLGVPDLLDEEAGLAVEFDGKDHRKRWQHREDNLREEGLEDLNLVVCRVDSLDLRYPVPLRERLRAAHRRGQARDRRRDRFTTEEPDWWRRRWAS